MIDWLCGAVADEDAIRPRVNSLRMSNMLVPSDELRPLIGESIHGAGCAFGDFGRRESFLVKLGGRLHLSDMDLSRIECFISIKSAPYLTWY
jgi:hypothetical protein